VALPCKKVRKRFFLKKEPKTFIFGSDTLFAVERLREKFFGRF